MTMAPLTDDKQSLRQCFRKLKELQIEIQNMNLDYAPCTELIDGNVK